MGLPVRNIEKLVKKETETVDSVIHDFNHLKRTASGAVWFVKFFNSSKEEQDMAYIAGLLHDIVRPATEKICHAKASSKHSAEILKQFNVPKEQAERILDAIASHREKRKWKDHLHESIFFVDKVLEQMGAYVIFRRCMYIGECKDYMNTPFMETMINHFRKRLEMFTASEFEPRFSRLVEYQHKMVVDFWEALKGDENWAIRLARYSYDAGRKKASLDETIRAFRPEDSKAKKIKQEALEYLDGKLFKKFDGLVG